MNGKCCCETNDERALKLAEIIENHKAVEGPLLPVLRETRLLYGYLPEEALKEISAGLGIHLTEVHQVVTFYSKFSTKPRGTYHISVCNGASCYVNGSKRILQMLQERLGLRVGECTADGRFSLEATHHIGICGLSPAMSINEDFYGRVTPERLDEILKLYQQ